MKADKLIKLSNGFVDRCFVKFENYFLVSTKKGGGPKGMKINKKRTNLSCLPVSSQSHNYETKDGKKGIQKKAKQ